LNNYLKYIKKPTSFNQTKEKPNAFDIDFYFFCKVNNFDYNNKDKDKYNSFKNIGLNGLIYHPKQLMNMFSKITLYNFLSNIYISCKINIEPIPIQNFVNKYLYNSSFDYLSNLLIKEKYRCLNNNYNILFLVFIGNEKIGIDLLEKIIEHKKINSEFNISICFNDDKIISSNKIKKMIKSNFDYYAIYKSKNMGTDITSTLLMYNEILKNHNFTHIYKFHTKSILPVYNELTNYLLKMPLDELIELKVENSNCIGSTNHYLNINSDGHNNILKTRYKQFIDMDKAFVAGTIFYAKNTVFNTVLDFVKNNNYRSYLFNNLYENNSINKDCSPIHFLERLFGVIKL
jgi:hypothetical protein